MSTDKLTGIIYRAYNTISGKSYIGKTVQPLKIRIRQHFSHAKKYNHKFANALKYYPKDTWKWEVLAEDIPVKDLGKYELFFIQDLDTYNSGYNSSLETDSQVISFDRTYEKATIYNLYHPRHGIVSGTIADLREFCPGIDNNLCHLKTGRQMSVKGWRLVENKDEVYRSDIINTPITLSHPELGTHTLLRKEFVTRFSLSRHRVCELIKGNRKSHKGWRLVK